MLVFGLQVNDWNRFVLMGIVFVMVAIVIADALATGGVRRPRHFGEFDYRRSTEPIQYWLWIAFLVGLAAFFLVHSLRGLDW